MHSSDGLGEAMGLAYAREAGERAQKHSSKLEGRVNQLEMFVLSLLEDRGRLLEIIREEIAEDRIRNAGPLTPEQEARIRRAMDLDADKAGERL